MKGIKSKDNAQGKNCKEHIQKSIECRLRNQLSVGYIELNKTWHIIQYYTFMTFSYILPNVAVSERKNQPGHCLIYMHLLPPYG